MTESNFNTENNLITSTHYIALCLLIFVLKFFARNKEKSSILHEFQEEDKKKRQWLMIKYLVIFNAAKAADWCLGPFVFELFQKYHGLTISHIGKLQALSFSSNIILGPFFVGFLNDRANKKTPLLLFSVLLLLVCFFRLIRNPLSLIVGQVFFGCTSSILYTSFENWLNAEAIITFPIAKTREIVLSSIFEK